MKKWDLRAEALERLMIVAHRGIAGGNIPCNTIAAYDAALLQGADMIELDVAGSADGALFAFHPGMEFPHLRSERLIRDMTAEEVSRLRFVNGDGTPTDRKVNTLDEVFEHLKGRCYINVDKYWENVGPITEAIRRHGIAEQVLVKSWPSEEVFSTMEQVAPDISFMVLQRDRDECSEHLMKRRLRYVGVEALFTYESSEIASREYVERMNEKGLLVWANSIVYNYREILTAGHTDDVAVLGDPDKGWGWLIDRGYNLIQTDWPLAMKNYISGRK